MTARRQDRLTTRLKGLATILWTALATAAVINMVALPSAICAALAGFLLCSWLTDHHHHDRQ